ncbi:hypothetical protein AB0M38_30735 [Streptomyces sp. NPDC051742]|uniref:hypothetical protein n=1 Tax=unclassified Streptomyces TaxID=2593676 RepID=UPI003438ED8F
MAEVADFLTWDFTELRAEPEFEIGISRRSPPPRPSTGVLNHPRERRRWARRLPLLRGLQGYRKSPTARLFVLNGFIATARLIQVDGDVQLGHGVRHLPGEALRRAFHQRCLLFGAGGIHVAGYWSAF